VRCAVLLLLPPARWVAIAGAVSVSYYYYCSQQARSCLQDLLLAP
jgi:hypothetical protein